MARGEDNILDGPLLAEVEEKVHLSTVGFIGETVEDGHPAPVLLGSGVLVQAGGRFAILTAAHVVQIPLRDHRIFALGTFNKRLPQSGRAIALADCEVVETPKPPNIFRGPDIALVILGEENAVWLRENQVFYNLDLRADYMLASPPPIDAFGWICAGGVEQWSKGHAVSRDRRRKVITGLVTAVAVTGERHDGQFDYFDVDAAKPLSPETVSALPETFKGVSGSGLWQVLVDADENGEPVVKGMLLSGVVYAEGVRDGDELLLHCHGRRSVYEWAVEKLRGKPSIPA